MTIRGSRRRPNLAVLVGLAAGLTLGACSADAGGVSGSRSSDLAAAPNRSERSVVPTPTDSVPSVSPTKGAEPVVSPTDAAEPMPSAAENLCTAFDLEDLVAIMGMSLSAGTFDGTTCTWRATDGSGTLAVSLGEWDRILGYIARLKRLDVGTGVTVAGADDAAAVTVTSGSGRNRTTRIALVARVDRLRLDVIVTGRRPALEAVVQIAERVASA